MANRLKAILGERGSQLYELTWKALDMPAGPPCCLLRASERRTGATGSSGFPTPTASAARRGRLYCGREPHRDVLPLDGWLTPTAMQTDRQETGRFRNTQGQAKQQVGWGTPTAVEGKRGVRPPRDHDRGVPLSQQVGQMTGWPTPIDRDYKDSPGMAPTSTNPDGSIRDRNDTVPRVAHGIMSASPLSPTGSPGPSQLNPSFTRWLMGFPAAWDDCVPTETPSSRR